MSSWVLRYYGKRAIAWGVGLFVGKKVVDIFKSMDNDPDVDFDDLLDDLDEDDITSLYGDKSMDA